MNFDIRKLRQRDIAIIMIVLSVALAAAWWYFLYQPTQDRIASLEADITRLDAQIVAGERARANLPQLRQTVAELEADRREFLAQLPRESDIGPFIERIRLTASESDVEIQSVSQGNANEDVQDVRPIGFTVSSNGDFLSTMTFLQQLETLQRFTKINQVGLNSGGGGDGAPDPNDPTLNANYNFTIYVYTGTDPGEQP